jgi:hypothetical protein
MNELDIAEKNKILKCITGSYLYGTNTENSDTDYQGIFIGNIDNYFGLKDIEEVSDNFISKNEFGKNNTDAIDSKYYEIRQFFKLALQNNPNIIELLFINKENIIFKNKYFNKIQENRDKFLSSKEIRKRFIGYAYGQKHKMIVKLENYDIFTEAYDILNNSDKKFLVDEDKFNVFKFKNNSNKEYKVADIFIPRNISVKRAKDLLQERLKRVGNRKELILKHGFDTKFASHTIRILYEGIELLKTKNLEFPLKERNLILDIKKGKYTCNEVIIMSEELEKEINDLNIIEFKQDYNFVNDMLINIIKDFLIK